MWTQSPELCVVQAAPHHGQARCHPVPPTGGTWVPQVRHMAGLVWWWPQPGSLEQPTFLVSQPWRLDGQEPPVGGAGSSEASLLRWEAAVSSPVPCSPSVPVSSSCKGASRAGSGPSYLFISTNYLFKDPLSKHSLWLRQWGFGLGGKDFLGGGIRPNPLGAQSSPGLPLRRGVNCQHQ